MSSSITIGSNTYTLIGLPSAPGLSDLSVTMLDRVAVVSSPYVPSQAQTQAWPGADAWAMEITLPKMNRATAAQWRGFLAELRGMSAVFQIGDPTCPAPLGVNSGALVPTLATSSTQNLAMATTLYTTNWTPSTANQLLYGDYLQIGYRLHMVCEACNSDASGNMQIPIWPSLREVPATTALTLANTTGLFRLAGNSRSWHTDTSGLTQLSFKCTEVR